MKFYLTFGQKYPWRNGWVEVVADNYFDAIGKVSDIFGDDYSNLYKEADFDKSVFPAGKIGETIR